MAAAAPGTGRTTQSPSGQSSTRSGPSGAAGAQAGVAHFDLLAFVGASIVSRSLRFFLVAAILYFFGDAARDFIERRLMLVTTVFAVCLVGGFVVLRYL